MKVTFYYAAATLLLSSLCFGEPNRWVKVATTSEGDLYADSEEASHSRDWNPMSDWMVPQRELILIARSRIKETISPPLSIDDAELTHLFWIRSFEGWWFLHVRYYMRLKDPNFRGDMPKSVFLLPNGAALRLVRK